MRFKFGEVYTVSVSPFFGAAAPSTEGVISGDVALGFSCDPANAKGLIQAALQEICKMQVRCLLGGAERRQMLSEIRAPVRFSLASSVLRSSLVVSSPVAYAGERPIGGRGQDGADAGAETARAAARGEQLLAGAAGRRVPVKDVSSRAAVPFFPSLGPCPHLSFVSLPPASRASS